MRSLLDVNLLLALFDAEHIQHGAAHNWWTRKEERPWATCPLTENGFLRIISNRSYSNPIALGDARSLLKKQTARAGHEFWPDDLSIADDAVVHRHHLLHPRQITDVYLLALAVKHGGRLVTFDRTVPLAAVRDAKLENLLVLP